MIKASEELIEMATRIDNMKKFKSNISENAKRIAFNDESFSLFPLYMVFAKEVDYDVLDYEPEAVRKIVGNDINGDRINAVISTTAHKDVWVNPLAFDIFTDAVIGNKINAEFLSPDYPEEIAISLINLAGIEGSFAMPVKTNVLKFIKACLDYDGWDIPPLPLFFKHITDYYDQDMVSFIKNKLGKLSLHDIARISKDDISKKVPENMVNYLTRTQNVVEHILQNFDKMLYDWTTVING